MANGNTVTLIGNATRDPEISQTKDGDTVANFGVAWNRRFQENGEWKSTPEFYDVGCFGTLADNVAATVRKGTRVVVHGRMQFSKWETDNGETRSKIRVQADDVSISLRWATAVVTGNPKNDNYSGGYGNSSSGYSDTSYGSSQSGSENDSSSNRMEPEEPF